MGYTYTFRLATLEVISVQADSILEAMRFLPVNARPVSYRRTGAIAQVLARLPSQEAA